MKKPVNLDKFGTSNPYVWTHEHLLKVLAYDDNSPVTEPRIKEAFRVIRRQDFVVDEHQQSAYEDRALPIGHEQTISQPTVVAHMLQLLNPVLDGKYLDIGTGSGYVAALLGKIVGPKGKVIGLERIQMLSEIARVNLSKYPELQNVEIVFKDGSKGYPEQSPYDGIHVGAAFDDVPDDLIKQLKVGGKLVVPTKEDDIRVFFKKSLQEINERIYPGYVFVPIREGVE
jgi:protein-L-isoaspartate(D-aspartate) O-methyltransferase